MQQSHTLSAFLYAISNGIERASYYGLRSLLILYMIGESLQMPYQEALAFYGWLTVSFYFSKVFGALLGDLLIGSKIAILIGGILQAAGCFLLCIEHVSMLYVSVGLIVLGNGFYSPNVFGQFGRQYTNKPKLVDAGFSGYFFFINVGAFLGIIAINSLGDKNFSYGFIFAGALMLVATAIAYFSKDNQEELQRKTHLNTDILKTIVFIVIAVMFACVFWACYELYYSTIGLLPLNEDFNISKVYEYTSGAGIIFALLLAILWTFVYTNQFLKFCVGLIISAIAVSMIISFSEAPENGSTSILMISGILLALAEAFLSPMLYAITTRYSNPKYLAILLSVVSLPILMFNKIAIKISEWTYDFNPSGIFIAITIVLTLFGISAIVMWFVQNLDDKKVLSQNKITE